MNTKIFTFLIFLITNSISGQVPKSAISIEDPDFSNYYSNDMNIPKVKGKILNMSKDELDDFSINYSIVTPFDAVQIKKNCKINADGTFDLELNHAFPYQQIWLRIGKLYYGGIYVNTDLFIELDVNKIHNENGIRFNGNGVKYLGSDGELNNYLNNHVLYKRNAQLEAGRELSKVKFDRRLSYTDFLKQYDSLYHILTEIDNEFIKKNPSDYSWIINNERLSAYYGDICVKNWYNEMSPKTFINVKNHKSYLTSNSGVMFYKYLYDYISIKAKKGVKLDYNSYKSFSKLKSLEIAKLDSLILCEKNISFDKPYDEKKYLTLLNDANVFLNDTLVTVYSLQISKYLDSIFIQPKSDLLKLYIASDDLNEQKLMFEVLFNTIETKWCKNVLQMQYDEKILKIASIEKILNDSSPLQVEKRLGLPITQMPTGAILYKIDSMHHETLLKNLKDVNENKALIIDFWATWCGPCLKEMPHSNKLQKTVIDLPVEFIYLCTSQGSDIEKWKSKIAQFELGGVHIFVEEQIIDELMKLFSKTGFPSYVFIDRRGDYQPGVISRMSQLNENKLIELLE